jgi:maleate isomerase
VSEYSSVFRIGTITPSSNTVLEPMSTRLCRNLVNVTLHFSRFRVVSISTKEQALGQFELAPMLEAARLLADARVDYIIWSGTSSGWLGIESDIRLCKAVKDETGVPATTSVLALFDAFEAVGATRIGLVTPYLEKIQRRIMNTFEAGGFSIIAEQHLSLEDNHSFGMVDEVQIDKMIRSVAKSQPDAISVFCTNLKGSAVVPKLERELGIPIFDTVATGLWKALDLGGVNLEPITSEGRIFGLRAKR